MTRVADVAHTLSRQGVPGGGQIGHAVLDAEVVVPIEPHQPTLSALGDFQRG